MEKQIDLIALGKAEKEAVVAHTLHQFAQKFGFFMEHINRMDQLFEASFSPLASSGKGRATECRFEASHIRQSVSNPCSISQGMAKFFTFPGSVNLTIYHIILEAGPLHQICLPGILELLGIVV